MSYNFKVGEKVKLRLWDSYTTRGIHPWAWLILDEVNDLYVRGHLDENPEVTFGAEPKELEPPLGFQEVYKVIVGDPKQKDQILGWLKDRGGISVWTSHDLGTAGRFMYTPGDRKDEKPHWSMGFVEVVTDPTRIEIHLEVSRSNKPERKELPKWKYDRRAREWYQVLKLFPV